MMLMPSVPLLSEVKRTSVSSRVRQSRTADRAPRPTLVSTSSTLARSTLPSGSPRISGRAKRVVNVRVGQVDKHRRRGVPDELDGFIGDRFGESALVGPIAHVRRPAIPTDHRQRREGPPADGILALVPGHMSLEYGIPKYSSKPCFRGRNSGWSPRCHSPKQPVTAALAFRSSPTNLVGIESPLLAGEHDPALHADAAGIRAGKAARRVMACRSCRRPELAQPQASVAIRSRCGVLVHRVAERADVTVAQVVDEHEHDVGVSGSASWRITQSSERAAAWIQRRNVRWSPIPRRRGRFDAVIDVDLAQRC